MSTCALADVDLKIKSWGNIGNKIDGQLINIWRPRELWGDKE
jgi:hypothetical protein